MAINFGETEAKKIIADGEIDLLITSAGTIGEALLKANLTSSQLRNIFTEVRRIESSWSTSPRQAYLATVLLQPKLAYAAAKALEKKSMDDSVAQLSSVLTPCIAMIQSAKEEQLQGEYFRRFVHFFEAILAYHKEAEEKRKREHSQPQHSQPKQDSQSSANRTYSQQRK